MNKVSKVILKRFLTILLFTTPILNARHGGSSFGGAMAGSMFGSMLGSAMTQPRRTHTVVVEKTGSGEISRNEVSRLEQNLRDEISNLESVVRSDLNKLYDRLRALEGKDRNLEDGIIEIKQSLQNIEEKLTEVTPVDKITGKIKDIKLSERKTSRKRSSKPKGAGRSTKIIEPAFIKTEEIADETPVMEDELVEETIQVK